MDNIIILSYLLGVMSLGLWAGRNVKDLEEYSVAGRSYPAIIVFATLSASFSGGGFTLGNAEKVFAMGVVNIVALWGFSLKEILVAKFIAPRMHHFPDAISVGDVMEKDYGKWGKVVSGIFSVLLCAGILGAQIGGMGYIFHVFLNIPIWVGILVGTGIVILYDTIGGMKAVVATDIVQFIVLVIGIPLCLYLGIRHVGGFTVLISQLPQGHLNIFSNITSWQFLSLFLTFLLGETLVPPYVQRLFVGKDSSHTAKGTLWSGLFSIPFFAVTGMIGLVALVMKPDLNPNLSLPYVVQQVLPVGIQGFVVAGIISVVMSSADSFLNSASVAFTNDIVGPFKKEKRQGRHGLFTARIATLITGSLATLFAVKINSVLDILIYAYNFWAPIIMIPLAATLLGVCATTRTFLAGATAGISGVLIWNRFLGKPGGFDGLIIGVFCNIIAFSLVHKFSTNRSSAAQSG
ncbi:MAG: sodium:solute symporter family protein [Deltaproteobacteria bacterium]|nr:sodium:solute symporter family protein [Deltaproteobacteria bacterium]